MPLSSIVAMSENRVIGRQGELPWRLSSDLRRFKRLTMGHHLIMGRKTFESIGRCLPGRTTVVLTRQPAFSAEGVRVARGWDDVQAIVAGDAEPFVIGGAQVYELALPHVDRIYLTRVHAQIEGDAFFPALLDAEWSRVQRAEHAADERNEFAHTFEVLERRRGA